MWICHGVDSNQNPNPQPILIIAPVCELVDARGCSIALLASAPPRHFHLACSPHVPRKIPQHARTTRRRAAAPTRPHGHLLPAIQGGPRSSYDPPGRAARPRRARDVGAALLGRRPAAKLGARRGRSRRRGGDVRVAVQPGAARARVRGAVRGARVGVPRLPLRLPHPVRPPISSLLPSFVSDENRENLRLGSRRFLVRSL